MLHHDVIYCEEFQVPYAVEGYVGWVLSNDAYRDKTIIHRYRQIDLSVLRSSVRALTYKHICRLSNPLGSDIHKRHFGGQTDMNSLSIYAMRGIVAPNCFSNYISYFN